jgi:hypothetical protein
VDEYRTMNGEAWDAVAGFARAWGGAVLWTKRDAYGYGSTHTFRLTTSRATFRVTARSPGWAIICIDSGKRTPTEEITHATN